MQSHFDPSAGSEAVKFVRYARLVSAALAFVFRQVFKTVKQPARLVAAPAYLARIFFPEHSRTTVQPPNALAPDDKQEERRLKALAHFNEGERLFGDDQPEAAWREFRECIETSDEPGHFFMAALTLIVGLGRYKEGIGVFARGNVIRRKRANSLGVANSPIRYLDRTWAGAFGHIAEIDYPIKLGILEGRQTKDTLLYVPPDVKVPNRFLLEQWRPLLTMVDREADLPLPPAALDTISFDFRGPLLADGSTAHYWEAAANTYRRWHSENRGPVLSFPKDVADRGRQALEKAGMPPGSWYIALHVREAASKALHATLHNVLNARIADYLPAIEEVTSRGGWVIRMGDPTMTPLSPMPNVLDYCHSNIRADWMDIFLFSHARFYIGTSSGPAYVPPIYGTPSVLTNWWPPAQRPWHPQDIFVPKLYRRLSDNTYLKLSETLAEPFGYCNSLEHIKKRENVVVEDNAPEDIRAAVLEMFERLEGTASYTPDDIARRDRTDRIYSENAGHGMASISRDFLRTHTSFIG